MKRFPLLLLSALAYMTATAQGDRFVCDGTCGPDGTLEGPGYFSVVSPVGTSAVKPVKPAPRLDTLDGKTIAVVGVSFMTQITHPEIKRLILEEYPSAHVILLDEIGYAGTFPAPGTRRKSVEVFQQNLRDMHVDAVISGNGGCGLCTPKETGSCIAAEVLGIPSVIIAGPGFADEARYTARNNGLPVLRVAEYPTAFASDTEAELIENTRDILWPQIVDALTRPFSPSELVVTGPTKPNVGGSGTINGINDDVFQGTIEEVFEYFSEMNWTDGMPFMPPTYESVLPFLNYTDHAWDEVIATLPPANRATTTWHVAVNACMAGCKPEYMPLLIAMVQGMGNAEFRKTLSSTHAWIPYTWVSGPVGRQLGISSEQGEICEKANVVIGRFLNLALMNLAGYYVGGEARMGTFGYPVSWCLAEDEAACVRIGWQPWHVQKGFGMNESTVTCASALLWGNNMAPSTHDPQKVMELLAWDIAERGQFALGSGKQFTDRVVLMTEPVAELLTRLYPTKNDIEDALIATARRPVKERAFANFYANPGGSKDLDYNFNQYMGHIRSYENAETTVTPPWCASNEPTMQTVATMEKGSTAFLVTGDAARNKMQTMPGGGNVTVRIELPANWDELMAELGYRPLSSFWLENPIPYDPRDVNRDRRLSISDVSTGVDELKQPSSPMTLPRLQQVVDGVMTTRATTK